ncbi:electron carrier [Thelotrema lepadinum]|nr:electron carrier [Thelotrema lepadinum]
MASSSSHASIVLATPPPTDLPAVPTVSNATPINARTLLLAPPSVAAHEDWLQEALGPLDRSMTDLQMLDRISVISMLPNTYDLIMIMTSVDGVRRNEALQFLDRKACTKLVRSMKIGARLETQDRPLKASDIPEAVLSGLTLEAGSFMKQELMEKAIPLRSNLGFKTTLALPLDDSDEELIDEDTLLTDEDRLFTKCNICQATESL